MNMSLVRLNVSKVEIPGELKTSFVTDGFTHPFAQYSHNMPKPPMKFWAGSQHKKNGIAPGSIFLTIEGEVYVSVCDFKALCEEYSREKAIEIVMRDIEILPQLWQWALDIRRRQELLVEKISTLLPGWEITGLEGRRFYFWDTDFSKIRSWIEFLRNKGVDMAPQECDLDNLVYRLRSIWAQTEEQKEKWRREKESSEEEKRKKEEEEKKEAREAREFVLSVLGTKGLLK